jgi:hypothetical protein
VIRDNRPQHKDLVTEEVENLSVIRDNRPQHKILVTEEIVNRDTSTPSPNGEYSFSQFSQGLPISTS